MRSTSELSRGCSDAGLERERGHGHRVLQQPAEVGVVADARAGRAPQLRPERVVGEEGVEQGAQVGVVHLAREVLEEAVELVQVAVGDRQEGGRVGAPRRARIALQLDLQLVPEALDPPAAPPPGRRARTGRRGSRRRGRRAPGSRRCGRAARRPGRACRSWPSAGPCGCRRTRPRPRSPRAARRRASACSTVAIASIVMGRPDGVGLPWIAMQDVIWSEPPKLRKPVMVCAFKGWNDAGEAASAAVAFIREQLRRARTSPDRPRGVLRLHRRAAHRPAHRGPDARDRLARQRPSPPRAVPGAEGDLVMLQGTEPSLRWRRYTDNLVATARELDVRMVITLGALLADVPHSRPVSITGHRVRPGAGREARLPAARATRGPPASSACSTTPAPSAGHRRPRACGPRCRTTWRPRPTRRWRWRWCAPSRASPGVVVDAGELESAAEDYERQVSAAVASDPEVKAFVERLESAMDEVEERRARRGEPPVSGHDRARLPALPAPARARG